MAETLAEMPGDPVWAVGGAVRDALLGSDVPPADLDLVVEGDARPVGAALAAALGVRATVHDRFGTVVLRTGARTIDLVTARREAYPEPGALPEVEPSTLADDLARRDFTVNALAVGLRGPSRGQIVDEHGGREDLEARLIRRIRSGEFSEDPSRIVRGARYAARLGFEIEPETASEMRRHAPAVDLGSARVAEEVRRMASEPGTAAGLRTLAELGVRWAEPGVSDEELQALEAAAARPGAPPVDLPSLRLGLGVAPEALAGSALAGWSRAAGRACRQGASLAARLRGAAASVVDREAGAAPPSAQVGAVAAGSAEVLAWWRSGRDLRLEISGEDLVAAGCHPGPSLGAGLAAARAAALDGSAPDRESQLRVALSVAAP